MRHSEAELSREFTIIDAEWRICGSGIKRVDRELELWDEFIIIYPSEWQGLLPPPKIPALKEAVDYCHLS